MLGITFKDPEKEKLRELVSELTKSQLELHSRQAQLYKELRDIMLAMRDVTNTVKIVRDDINYMIDIVDSPPSFKPSKVPTEELKYIG